MNLEDILTKKPEAACRYLVEHSGVSVVFVARDMTVVDCNRGFMDLTGLSVKPAGRRIDELASGVFGGLSLPEDDGFAVNELTVRTDSGGIVGMRAQIIRLGDGYLMFAEADPALMPDDAATLRKELDRLKNTDPLTGLTNVEHFMHEMKKAVELAHRRNTPLSLMLCDLDNFKFITDTYGRDTADRVLSAFARIMEDNTRDVDLPARFRGDEFSLLMPYTDAEHGLHCAERMWEKVSELNVEGVRAKLSASFGVTMLKEGDDADALIKRAESAVYKAKTAFPKNVAVV